MNLERVETLCLNYLANATSPLVPLADLLEHCRRDAQCAALTLSELRGFLEHHERVHVLEGERTANPEDHKFLTSLGMESGPRAILNTRIPSQAEMARHISQNLTNMTRALETALAEAEAQKDIANVERILEALSRTRTLEEKFQHLF